jgi:hypothetical protein
MTNRTIRHASNLMVSVTLIRFPIPESVSIKPPIKMGPHNLFWWLFSIFLTLTVLKGKGAIVTNILHTLSFKFLDLTEFEYLLISFIRNICSILLSRDLDKVRRLHMFQTRRNTCPKGLRPRTLPN